MNVSKNRTHKVRVSVKFDNPSWIRVWFMRQDDFTLWIIGFIWVLTQFTLAIAICTAILKGLAS